MSCPSRPVFRVPFSCDFSECSPFLASFFGFFLVGSPMVYTVMSAQLVPEELPPWFSAPLPIPVGDPLPSWLLPGGRETKAPSLDQAMTWAHWSFHASLPFLPLSD